MIYRTAQAGEHSSLVAIHQEAFHDFFLTDLGPRFLGEYYHAVLKNPGSIAVCAVNDEGQLIGFATGSQSATGYNRRLLLSHWPAFMVQTVRLLFTRPRAILRLLKNMEKQAFAGDNGQYAELLSIAVLPSAKGLGVGKGLLQCFEETALRHGCRKVSLTTDYHDNESVVAFYRKNGYTTFYEFVTYPNRRMYKLIKKLDKKLASSYETTL
tara:strand:+ start:14815 stop:15447 length:633 start_codon:yes stop_codon:yes gene_type:complete